MRHKSSVSCLPYSRVLGIIVAIVASIWCTTVRAQTVLFSDSFDRITGFNDDPENLENFSDWGSNDNELGGVIIQEYTMDTSRPGGAQSTVDGEMAILRNGAVQIDADFSSFAPFGYTIEFEFTRTTGNGFVALGIGLDPSVIPEKTGFNGNAFLFDVDPTVDGAVLFQQDNENEGNGRVQVFNASQSVVSEPNAFFDNEDRHSAFISVAAPNGYDDGDVADVVVLVDGNNPISSTIDFDGENSGYLALYSNQTGATIDNLVITAISAENRPCDFDADGACDLSDLDELLYSGLGGDDAKYDLDGNGLVDLEDRNALLRTIDRSDGGTGSLPGDSSLNGMTDATDLNDVGLRWQQNATSFSSGDFNGDSIVDATDLNEIGIHWQQSSDDFAQQNAAAVPETTGSLLLWGLAVGWILQRRVR